MKILVFDIEVAPMEVRTWRLKIPSGYIPPENIIRPSYVLSFAASWLGSKEVEFHHTGGGHKAMLKRMARMLEKADAVVHFNGKRFDVPTMMGEFLIHGVEPPKNMPVQIDLLPMAKRVFNLPSYKLDYISGVLGLGSKVKHQGYDLWLECDANRNKPKAKCWQRMEKYNKHDVVLTSKLYYKLRPWFRMAHGYKRIAEWLDGERKRP